MVTCFARRNMPAEILIVRANAAFCTKRGKNRLFNKFYARGKTTLLPKRTQFVAYLQTIARKRQNHAFAFFPQFAERLAERVKPRDSILCVPLNNGAPENRNERSGVRFLGIRSNKCTRAWRQTERAACPPSPCCDMRRGENRSGFPSNRRRLFLSAQNNFREPF